MLWLVRFFLVVVLAVVVVVHNLFFRPWAYFAIDCSLLVAVCKYVCMLVCLYLLVGVREEGFRE